MASGIGGAAFLKNLPAEGTYAVNEPIFDRETERNDVGLTPTAFNLGTTAPIDLRIPNVGILAAVKLVLKGSLIVAGAGTATSNYQWPWNLLKRITLNANGQTSLLSAEGLDFRARRNRVWRMPREHNGTASFLHSAPATNVGDGSPAPGVIANGTYPLVLEWEVPIVHDDETLAGALFAQSDANYLNLRIQPAATSEVLTLAGGSTATLAATISPTLTFFDIPLVTSNGKDLVVIPDLSWLHGFLSSDQAFANTGDVRVALVRTSGQLLALMFYFDNGGASQIALTALSELRWAFGANRKPRVVSPEALISKNLRDYNGQVGPGMGLFDFEIDKPARDLVYPKGLVELGLEAVVPTGTTVNANARVHTVLDTLYKGV
jgi:hypothetical protein